MGGAVVREVVSRVITRVSVCGRHRCVRGARQSAQMDGRMPHTRVIYLIAALLFTPPAVAEADPCAVSFGDVDASAEATVVDVQCVIVTLLWSLGDANPPLPHCLVGPLSSADLSCDGTVSVSDALLAIGATLGEELNAALDTDANGCPDACAPPECTTPDWTLSAPLSTLSAVEPESGLGALFPLAPNEIAPAPAEVHCAAPPCPTSPAAPMRWRCSICLKMPTSKIPTGSCCAPDQRRCRGIMHECEKLRRRR